MRTADHWNVRQARPLDDRTCLNCAQHNCPERDEGAPRIGRLPNTCDAHLLASTPAPHTVDGDSARKHLMQLSNAWDQYKRRYGGAGQLAVTIERSINDLAGDLYPPVASDVAPEEE